MRIAEGTTSDATPPPEGSTDATEFDFPPPGPPRVDPPAALQLETGGVIAQSPIHLADAQKGLSQSEFWARQTAHKMSVAAKLREAGLSTEADKLEDCHSHYTVAQCQSCGKTTKFPNRCDLFYCPECQPRLSRDRRESVEWWAKEIKQPKHVVLTVRNVPELTAGHVAELKRWFTRLRRRSFCRNWQGGFYSVEVTNESRGFHLHMHVLVDAKWIDAGELARQWASVTNGSGLIVKVRDCRKADYLAEVTKYAVKGSQLAAWSPSNIAQFVRAFDGQRSFGVFGALFGKRTEFAEWLKSIRDHKPQCDCGSCNVRYFSESEWLLRDLTATPNTQPRPPSPTRQLALAIATPPPTPNAYALGA